MKKSTLIIWIMLLVISYSNAQTSKHGFLLGGSTSISFNTDGAYDLKFFPSIGYFLSEDFCVGASVPLLFFNYEQSNAYYIGISPFGRYYFGENDKTRFFGLCRVNLSFSDNLTINNYGLVDLGVGHVWFINNSIGLEAEIIGNLAPDDVTIGAYLGFQIYFNTK
jgi:hypothetical protein